MIIIIKQAIHHFRIKLQIWLQLLIIKNQKFNIPQIKTNLLKWLELLFFQQACYQKYLTVVRKSKTWWRTYRVQTLSYRTTSSPLRHLPQWPILSIPRLPFNHTLHFSRLVSITTTNLNISSSYLRLPRHPQPILHMFSQHLSFLESPIISGMQLIQSKVLCHSFVAWRRRQRSVVQQWALW